MIRVLFDTNIVLDVLLARKPWADESRLVWKAISDGFITGFITATTVTNLFFIMNKISGETKAKQAIQTCLNTFEICLVNRYTIELATTYSGSDFEDNVQIACAVQSQLDGIITRDKNGFLASPIRIFTSQEFIVYLASSQTQQP